MAATPLVSVIIPVWNPGAVLAETLDSVLGQSYRPFEVIVVDDGSTDTTTVALLERYRPSVALIRQPHQGVGAARNAGLAAASGDYIAFIDHDDVWVTRALETQVRVALRFPDSGMVVGSGIQVDGDTTLRSRLISEPFWTRLLDSGADAVSDDFFTDVLAVNPAACPAQTLLPRAVCERIGPITTDPREAEDLDYTIRIAALYPLTLHKYSLVRWRYLESSRSGPRRRRRLVWAAAHTRVLARHLRSATGERRTVISAQLARLVNDTAKAGYHHARLHPDDLPFARAFLAEYVRSHPSFFTAACLAGLWAPGGVATRLARVYRSIEHTFLASAASRSS